MKMNSADHSPFHFVRWLTSLSPGVQTLFALTLLGGAISVSTPCAAAPIPGEAAWQTGMKVEASKEGADRIFLVNRGWISGRVTKIDQTSVTFDSGGQAQTFPRAEVSLLELVDWLSPEKRADKQEIKVRIVLEGEAEIATLLFTRGTIVSKVDAAPAFTAGADGDDQAGTDRTAVWFNKGNKDHSVTTLSADVTLLVPTPELLECELICARANGFAGPLNVRFLNPADGRELVSLKRPTKDLWSRFDIPVVKLKAGSSPSKVDCIPASEVLAPNVKTLPPQAAATAPRTTTDARLFLFDYLPVVGRVLSMDDYSVRVQIGIGQPVLIPRGRIKCIELNDWEAPFREAKPSRGSTSNLTVPLTVSFSGPSARCELSFSTPGDAIAQVIVPPHFVSGWDRDDVGLVPSERAIGFEKTVVDRSPSQVEATIVLKIESKQSVEINVNNGYTNIWAGDLRVNIYETLTRKPVEASGPATQKNLASSLKISRSRLISP